MNCKRFLPLLLAAAVTSCSTPKDIAYFQDVDLLPDTLFNATLPSNVSIAPTDELNIIVSAENMAAVASFNKPMYTSRSSNEKQPTTQLSIQSYVVDAEGYINFPTIGKVKAQGLTTEALADTLEHRIEAYVAHPVVTIDPLSFQVQVLGEVTQPGVVYMQSGHATILNAISKAHDLTIYGNRTNVLLLREEEEGRIVKHRIDLTRSDVLTSPEYVLRQNDVIYVSPNHARQSSSKYNSMKQQNLSMISTVVSVVSVLTSLAIAIWK